MTMTEFGLRFNRILRDFEEGYTADATRIENEFLAKLDALKERVKELKSQPKAKRTVRSRVKQFEGNEENKAAAVEENDAPAGGRTKRKAALKARQVSEALTSTRKGTKRKSSQSPVNERVKRKEDAAEVVKPNTRRTRGRPRRNDKKEESVEIEKSVVKTVECTVVLQNVQTVTVHNKVVSAEVESSMVKSKISKLNSTSEANLTKTLFKFPPSKPIDEVPSTSKASPKEPDAKSGNSEKDSGSNQSSPDKTLTPKNKRSSSRVAAKEIPKPSTPNQEKNMDAESNSDSELMSPEKKVPKMAEPSVQSLSTEKDTSVGVSVKASPVKKLTKANMGLPKEDKLTPTGSPAEDSDESTLTESVTGQKRTRSKMAPPKGKAVSPVRSAEEDSQSTVTESVTGQKRTRSKNVPLKGKEVPPTRSHEEDKDESEASSSEASPENDVLKKPKTPPLKDEDKSRKIASGLNDEDTPVTKNDTSVRRKTRSKMAPPKENKDALIRSESEKDIPEATVKHPTPEKRITRSKMAPTKVNNDNQTRLAGEDESDSKKATPEKRVTRSKAAKPKEKKIEIVSGSSDEDTPQQKAKPPIELPMSGVKVKELAGFFSPAVNSRNNILEKENIFNLQLKTGEKRQVTKATPLQVRNAFIVTPSSNSKSKFSAGVFSASKSKTAFDELERRRKEEEAKLKMLKEEEALRKKRELMKAKQEEIRRKNEEKMQKAAAARRAVDKETNQRLVKMEKEKEERDRLARELLEKKKEEEANRKKIFNEMKAQEAEIRRQREEAARIAKLKEAEEEKRREEELRQRQQEEMERLKKQRMEEMRMKEAALKAREMQKKKANVIPLKDKDNYDISDVAAGDDSDEDESNPKKELPLWARKGEEKDRTERIQSLVSVEVAAKYFACPSQSPDLTEFFGKMTMKRVRTSSAVWLHTPPLSRIQE